MCVCVWNAKAAKNRSPDISRLEEIVARKSACAASTCACCVYIKSHRSAKIAPIGEFSREYLRVLRCVYIKSHRSAINANFRACCEFLPELRIAQLLRARSCCDYSKSHRSAINANFRACCEFLPELRIAQLLRARSCCDYSKSHRSAINANFRACCEFLPELRNRSAFARVRAAIIQNRTDRQLTRIFARVANSYPS